MVAGCTTLQANCGTSGAGLLVPRKPNSRGRRAHVRLDRGTLTRTIMTITSPDIDRKSHSYLLGVAEADGIHLREVLRDLVAVTNDKRPEWRQKTGQEMFGAV